jgi:hypothetical protein
MDSTDVYAALDLDEFLVFANGMSLRDLVTNSPPTTGAWCLGQQDVEWSGGGRCPLLDAKVSLKSCEPKLLNSIC